MPDVNLPSEDKSGMPDPNRSQLSSNGGYDSAVQFARITERLETLIESVRDLTKKVGEQNGRIGKLETERALVQLRNVEVARTEVSVEDKLETILEKCECKMGTMGERVSDLESFRDQAKGAKISDKLDGMETRMQVVEGFVKEAGGAFKATLVVVEKAAMILTLFFALWRMVGDRAEIVHTHEPAPATQQQRLK